MVWVQVEGSNEIKAYEFESQDQLPPEKFVVVSIDGVRNYIDTPSNNKDTSSLPEENNPPPDNISSDNTE